jgi:hypothetical protein
VVIVGAALFLAQEALAQSDRSVAAGSRVTPSARDMGPARFTEIRVELAWLADPRVCPFYPVARVQGNTIVVGGYLPNKSAHMTALQIVRRQCDLMIVDQLKETPGMTAHRTPAVPEQLRRAAEIALSVGFPQYAGRLSVTCGDEGRLTVSGMVSSPEDQLKISQRLRRLDGCGSVLSLLEVEMYRSMPLPRYAPQPAVTVARAATQPRVVEAPVSADTAAPIVPVVATEPAPVASSKIPVREMARPDGSLAEVEEPASVEMASPSAPSTTTRPQRAAPALGEPTIRQGYAILAPVWSEPRRSLQQAQIVPNPTQERLRQRVRQACAECRGADISFGPSGEMRIILRVNDAGQGDRLVARIMQLPELVNVPTPHIQVEVGR